MAKSKSTTTTPKAKAKSKLSTPKSAPAVPAGLTIPPSSNQNLDENDLSDAASAAVASETATPARKQAKRKAPQDDAAAAAAASSSTKKPKVSMHTEQAVLTSTSASGKKATHQHRNVRIEIPAASVSTPAKGKHIVFNNADNDEDEELEEEDVPSEFFTPQEDVKANPLEAQLSKAEGHAGKEAEEESSNDDDDDDDDDDDAPEAVSTSTAAAQAAKATQGAARAVELQRDEQRRKRQARDAQFRKQAEARKKQPAPAAEAKDKQDDDDDDEDANKDIEASPKLPAEARLVTSLAPSSRKRLDRRNLPAVLPDEFLASDSEADGDEDEAEGQGRSARRATKKKITFNTAARQVAMAGPRHPADQRVGATVYRVMKKQGEARLAPRGGKYSKNAREMLLVRGRTVPKTGVKTKGGFLVR